jgi:hypothetical protein
VLGERGDKLVVDLRITQIWIKGRGWSYGRQGLARKSQEIQKDP